MITKQIVLSFDDEFENWFISEGNYFTEYPFTPVEIIQAIEQLNLYVKSKHQNYLIKNFMLNQSGVSLESSLISNEGVPQELNSLENDDKELNLKGIEYVESNVLSE